MTASVSYRIPHRVFPLTGWNFWSLKYLWLTIFLWFTNLWKSEHFVIRSAPTREARRKIHAYANKWQPKRERKSLFFFDCDTRSNISHDFIRPNLSIIGYWVPLERKKRKGKNFSESEKYRVYVLRDNVSTLSNIVTVIILRGTNLHTKLLSNEGWVPFVGQHKHKYIK